MNVQEFAERVGAGEEQQSTETAAFVEFIPLLIPLFLQLPCLKGKSAQEQHAWVKEHPVRSISLAAKQIREADPSVSKKEAKRRARRLWEEQSKLTDEEASQLVGSV